MRFVDYDGKIYTVPMTKDVNGAWGTNWQTPPGPAGTKVVVQLLVIAADGTTSAEVIGTITRYDPSGTITDAVLGCAVMGVRIELQRYINGEWETADPLEMVGEISIMDPRMNPQYTDVDGKYGWDVVAGLWRVIASRDGYVTQVSRSVLVPPPVTDLHLEMVPTGQPGVGCTTLKATALIAEPAPPRTGSAGFATGISHGSAPVGALSLLAMILVGGGWCVTGRRPR